MFQEGIVERFCSTWGSSSVMVKKADATYRFCVNYRDLNQSPRRIPTPFRICTQLRQAPQGRTHVKNRPRMGLFPGLVKSGVPMTFQRPIDALFGPELRKSFRTPEIPRISRIMNLIEFSQYQNLQYPKRSDNCQDFGHGGLVRQISTKRSD